MDEWYLDISDTPRAQRREYREKGAGRRMRGMGSRIRFNPDAWDADNDGFVQDSTPFQRPAIPGVNDFASGLRRRARQMVGLKPSSQEQQQPRRMTTARPRLVDQLRRNLPARNQKPENAHQRKDYSYGDISELNEMPIRANRREWLKGLTSDQISKLVVPNSEDQYLEMWSDAKIPHLPESISKESRSLFSKYSKDIPSRDIDFSPEAVEEMQLLVKQSLDESPSFKWAVENFGMQFVVKRTNKAVTAFNDEPAQKLYLQDQLSKGIDKGSVLMPFATTYGTSRTTFLNSGINEKFKFGEQGYTLSDLSVIDGTAGGVLRHEWGHYLMSTLIDDDELPTNARFFGGSSMYEAKAIAEKYNSEGNLSKNLIDGLKDKSLPYARSTNAHTSMPEMFAEGISAYTHPNDAVRHFAINDVMRRDIEKSLSLQDGERPWEKTGFSSGGRKSRRSNPDQLRLDMDIPESKPTTKINVQEIPKKPEKPFSPRPPDNGPLTGKFQEIFRGVKSFEEFQERYNSLEIIYFDYETTGLGEDDRPIQLGAVRIKGGKVVDRFNVFMNPEKQLSDWSLKNLKDINGNPLTQNWVEQQTTMKEAHAQFIAWAGQGQLLGGQYTPFDLGFLERTLKQQGLKFDHAGVIDSKAIADELLPRWSRENPVGPFMVDEKKGTKFASSSLKPVADFLGIDMGGGWHTADVDSETSALNVSAMIQYAIDHPESPRTILDIDGIPKRQEEKHIKYAKQMAEFPKKMEQYEKDLKVWEEYQALGDAPQQEIDSRTVEMDMERGRKKTNRERGLSSGSADRNLKPGAYEGKSETLKTSKINVRKFDDDDDDDDETYVAPEFTVQAHKIGNERVVFGQTRSDLDFSKENPDVKFLPINPYAISGYDPESQEGQDLAIKWVMARVAYLKENKDAYDTYIDALLYAASRGDSSAMKKLNEYADRGETYVNQAKESLIEASYPQLSQNYLDAINKEGLSDFQIEDIFLVHETKYPPEYDKDGNVVLRPLGDYGLTDPKTGKTHDYHRGTLHFTINHLAKGHMMRPRQKGTYIYVVPMTSVLEQNEGSLDALAAFDTYLSPKPNSPLKLPKPEVIHNTDDVEDIDAEMESVITRLGGKPFKAGDDGTSTSPGQDGRIIQLAKENRVLTGLHAENIYGIVEDYGKDSHKPYMFTDRDIAKLGRNAMLRLANNDRFSSTIRISTGDF